MLLRSVLKRAGWILDQVKPISTSCHLWIDQNWREEHGLPDNPNRERILRDLPDYSFLDGRPTPYGSRHRLRILKQREYTAKIVELTKEMDYAVERHAALQQQKQEEIKQILSKKLKRKGRKQINS